MRAWVRHARARARAMLRQLEAAALRLKARRVERESLRAPSRARGAAITSAKLPKRARSALASGLVSRRGRAANNVNSRSS